MKISAKSTTAALSLAALVMSSGAATAFGLRDAFVKFEGYTFLTLDPDPSLTPGIVAKNEQQKGRWFKRKPKVSSRWSPEKQTLTLIISSGCLQSSAGDPGDLVKVSLDRENRRIVVTGAFWYKVSSKKQTRDCMRTQTYERVFRGLDYGAYTLQVGDEPETRLMLGIS
ncbi:hypothetical protein [uncultured Roseibium sp.]|uniref:hypothetical protein n=1 Tax=uncultured Roseibium sp. TaxID=1936171 RepID=UPI0025948FB0|nr:hypothetical protein [uncultured Roseibium sp.]